MSDTQDREIKDREMRDIREWSTPRWIGVTALVIGTGVGIGFMVQALKTAHGRSQVGDVLKDIAAAAALFSLVLTAANLSFGWRRSKRQATIDAWNSWSDKTKDARKLVSAHLGKETITAEHGQALADPDADLVDIKGKTLSGDEKRRFVFEIAFILNGLERIAVGVEQGVYDRGTVTKLGGTIVARSYERFGPYIEARRTHPDELLRQTTAFVALEDFCDQIERKKLLTRKQQIDNKRIERLKRRRG